LGETACNLEINDLTKNKAILLKTSQKPKLVNLKDVKVDDDDVLITFYKSYVHPQDGVMIYKITYKGKSVVYATDKECYFGGDKKFSRFAKDCDLLIHDTQYTTEDYLSPYSPKQGYGHSTYDMAVEVMNQTKAKSLAFYHYDPSYDDARLSRVKERYTLDNKNIIMSYEGLEINIL
jgi:ribonuclease BN (tRNA processing enzyme)